MEAKTGNSGMLYHELQVRQLCGLHALNTALQGPFFSEGDLMEIAADLDARERKVMSRAGGVGAGDFLAEGQGSHNVSDNGDFGVEVNFPSPLLLYLSGSLTAFDLILRVIFLDYY